MAVDRTIISGSGEVGADTGFTLSDSLYSLIHRSISTRKGSQFWNKEFGSLIHTIRKCSVENSKLAAQYAEHSCKWIVDAKYVRSITAVGQVDPVNESRINIEIHAIRIDGGSSTYTVWYPVV